MPHSKKLHSPFRYFNSSPEAILVAMIYVPFSLSLSNIKEMLAERGIDNFHKTMRNCATGSTLSLPPTYAGSA